MKKRKTTGDFTQLQQEKKRLELEDEDNEKTEEIPAEEAKEEEEVEGELQGSLQRKLQKKKAEKDEEKVAVRIQDLLVEDPNAVLGDADVEQESKKVDEGGKAFKCPLKGIF